MIEIKKKVKIPLYGGWIVIAISDEVNVYGLASRHFDINNEYLKDCDGVVLGNADNSDRIYPLLLSNKITPGLIAHEAKHVVNKIFIDVDISLDRINDEAETYLLSWIVNRIWEVNTTFEKKKKTVV